MSENILMDLNVDALFEKCYITEIANTHQKIKMVVDRKSVDLRTMVGERYRDLLKAADTITAMQASSKALLGQVESINGYCKNLNDQQLLGFKTENDTVREIQLLKRNKQAANYFSTMVQIKLLVALPALIWSSLDQEYYYRATELFIFSRHISAGLQLDSDNLLMRKLPIVKTQWEMIKPFHTTIKQEVFNALKKEDLVADVAVGCLLAILQLEHCSMNTALKAFLNLRCSAFGNCLVNEQSGRIKERIITSLKILCESLSLIGDCFLENGLLAKKLSELSDPQSPSTILKLSTNDIQDIDLLPDIILKFKPTFSHNALSNNDVNTALKEWSLDVGHLANDHLKQMINLINDIDLIYKIKIEASSTVKQLNLKQFASPSDTEVQPLDFYTVYYLPLINKRIHDIINDNWCNAIKNVFKSIRSNIEERQIGDQKQYMTSMWEELPTDIPSTLAEASKDDLKSKHLLMKCKGYDSQIIEICTEFDQELCNINEKIDILLQEPISKQTDNLHLIDFLFQTAEKHLLDFLQKISDLPRVICQQRLSVIFIANCCCALIELCPNLKVCYCQRSTWRQQLGCSGLQKSGQEHWQNICDKFEKTICALWTFIIEDLLNEYRCEGHLPQIISNQMILTDFAQWETITWEAKHQLDEPKEDSEPVEQHEQSQNILHSSIRIPTQPCISLQIYFHTLINELNEMIPQTLPPSALNIFHEKLLQQFINYYQKLFDNNREIISSTQTHGQNVAIQLYFDMRFLNKLLNIQSHEKKEQFQHLQNTCKNFIDPIDFELLSTHISNNVQNAVARTSCLLGVLMPVQLQTNLYQTSTTPATSTTASGTTAASVSAGCFSTTSFNENDPNVLSLCSTNSATIWFPLLPVVSSSNAQLISGSTGAVDYRLLPTIVAEDKNSSISKMSTTSRKTESKTSKPSSGATSFFGSMSQDWFR